MTELRLDAGASAKQDLRVLNKAERDGAASMTPPMARLTMTQMAEIERLAGLGLNLFQIGVQLRFESETWEKIVACNYDVREIYRAGRVRATAEHAQNVYDNAVGQGDWQASKWWLERFGGQQYADKPKRVEIAHVEDEAAAMEIEATASRVFDSVEDAIHRQRALINETGPIETPEGEE